MVQCKRKTGKVRVERLLVRKRAKAAKEAARKVS